MESKQEDRSTEAPKKKRARPEPDLDTLRNAELVPAIDYHRIEPAFSPASLRWHLLHRDQNGLAASGAVVKIGRRVLIAPKKFRAWVQAGGSAIAPKGKRS